MQGLENWSDKEDTLDLLQSFRLETSFYFKPFFKSTFTNTSKSVDLITKVPLFYLVKRGISSNSLDQVLLNQAEKNGVNVHFDKTIPVNEADIIATGPFNKKPAAFGQGITFKTNHKDISVSIINNSTSCLAYAYLLVADGHGCIATVLFDDFTNAKNYLKESIKTFEKITRITYENTRPFGSFGNFSLQPEYKDGDALLVGEAAGLQDFLAGFGMKTAIKSGYLAARSIIENTDYQEIAKREFSDYLKAGIVNRYLFEKDAKHHHKLFLSGIERPDFPEILQSLYNFNKYQRRLYPLAYRYIKKKYPKVLGKTAKTVHL